MADTSADPLLHAITGKNTRGLLRIIILCTIAAAAISSRLFSVISKSTTRAIGLGYDTIAGSERILLTSCRVREYHSRMYVFHPLSSLLPAELLDEQDLRYL